MRPLVRRALVFVCVILAPALPPSAQERGAAAAAGATAAPALEAAAESPPKKPPVLNRANHLMPAWLRIRGEFRERAEGFDGAGFAPGQEDLYYLSRLRLNATIAPARALSFQLQVQDARVARKSVGPTGAPFKAPFDLRMAFADIGRPDGRLEVRAGRQELAFGDQRLVGHVGWLNAARTFDAVRATIRLPAFQVQAFGASVVRILDGRFDRSGNGNRFLGAYGTTASLLPGSTVEPYLFWRRDVNLPTETATVGDLKQTTAGVRLAGRATSRLAYDAEMALQRGSLGTDTVRAWAGHWRVNGLLIERATVRLIGEYNVASGDSDPADGVRGTFDQLYPTGHDKYGLADQIGWRNIHHLRGGVEFTPVRNLPIAASYHSWWLVERRDGIYNAGGAPLARVITGAANRHVGQELDLQVTRALTPQLQVAAGYAHIFPGAFLREATPGAAYSHPYVMATYVFLAER